MDLKVSLEDITQPAHSECFQPSSRVSSVFPSDWVRINQEGPESEDVLSSDSVDRQNMNLDYPLEELDPNHEVSEEENEDLEVAINKMKKLDRMLAVKTSSEKEVKKKGRELHQRLWKELEDLKPQWTSECSNEAENTRLFLALTSSTSKSCSEEVDFVPVFGTQVADLENGLNSRSVNEEVRLHGDSSGSAEGDREETQDKQTDNIQSTVGKIKHRQDFIKKNIELAGSAGNLMPMTQEEKDRLAELLKDLDEEVANADPLDKPETDFSLCAVSTTPGEGYTPVPSELDKLLHIDAKLQLLLPVEEFLSVRSPYSFHSFCQEGRAGEPGERVLWDMKESRGQEEFLCEIQQQLQLLMPSQHTASLTEEQMRSLLRECEMASSRCSGSITEDFPDSRLYGAFDGQTMSLLASTPRLSSSALSALLQESCGSHASFDQSDETSSSPYGGSESELNIFNETKA